MEIGLPREDGDSTPVTLCGYSPNADCNFRVHWADTPGESQV